MWVGDRLKRVSHQPGGFQVTVMEAAVRGVNVAPGDAANALAEKQAAEAALG